MIFYLCLLSFRRRANTPSILFYTESCVYSGELEMYEICAETLGCHLQQLRVESPCIVYNEASLLPALFVVGSHC